MINFLINYIVLFLVLFYFIIASLEDIKKREVYDYINYSLSFFILTIAIFHSIYINSLEPIKLVGFGLILGFLLGSILYYLGIWGGGDAKFLIGFSASTYYILHFIKPEVSIPFINLNFSIKTLFEIINIKYGNVISFVSENVILVILLINILFLFFILLSFLKSIKDKKRIKNLLVLSSILLFLTSGLYFNYSTPILILIGFIAFLLLFFADDEIFNSVYIKISKNIDELKVGDLLVRNFKINNKNIISHENMISGIEENDIEKLKKIKKKTFEVKKILPYSILIGLNYILYIIKIIQLNSNNLEILFFQLRFLFLSFLVGGVITLIIIFFLTLKNYKKVKIKISKKIKYLLLSSFILITILSIIDNRFIILYSLILIYLLLKIGKCIENLIFVKKKPIEKIVPGDWIVEDIIINDKLIYSAEDFKLGINEMQLERINKLRIKHPEFKSIFVKDGVAFIPPLFIAFIILLVV